jgi:hypothetical protein
MFSFSVEGDALVHIINVDGVVVEAGAEATGFGTEDGRFGRTGGERSK